MNSENTENKHLQIKFLRYFYLRSFWGHAVYTFRKKTAVKTDLRRPEYLNQNISLPGILKITKILTAPQVRIAVRFQYT